MKNISAEDVARVARIYKRNLDASQALGVAVRYFASLCRKYDIETPYARKRRQNGAAGAS